MRWAAAFLWGSTLRSKIEVRIRKLRDYSRTRLILWMVAFTVIAITPSRAQESQIGDLKGRRCSLGARRAARESDGGIYGV